MIKGHPMSGLKGTDAGRQLMSQVRSHKKGTPMKKKLVEGSAPEERTESAPFEKKEDAGAKTRVGAKPGEAANTAGSSYADPGYQKDGRKRYPLDTPEHVRAAASYFANPKNRAKYSAAQAKEIQGRIDAAKSKNQIGSDETDAALNFVARMNQRKKK